MSSKFSLGSRRTQFELGAFALLAVLLLVVLPWWSPYGVTSGLWGKYLSYALLAISVDLLWGSTGLLSLGQALFFSLGGYMHGMYLMRMIGDLGQHKLPIPDFLVMLGWRTELPGFWEPFSSFTFSMVMVVIVPAVVAYIFGFLAFRSRIKGVYFSILTQALTYAFSIIFFRNNLLMGGNNGMTDFKFILGHNLRDPATMRGLFVATSIVLLLTFLLCRWLRTTKFGLVQRAIRDGENRTLFSGYATAHYKLFVFVLCAIIAAIGGALYVPQAGIINPEEMKTVNSLEAVVWVAVGGRGTLIGPILGAVSINLLKSWATQGATANDWPLIMGGLFVLVVLFLPGGLVSLPGKLFTKKTAGTAPPKSDSSTPNGSASDGRPSSDEPEPEATASAAAPTKS